MCSVGMHIIADTMETCDGQAITQLTEYSPENKLHAKCFGRNGEKSQKMKHAENDSSEKKPKEKKEDKENDSDKLAMGDWLMREYDYPTLTFAESVAKFLLGPDRAVKATETTWRSGAT